MRQRKYFLFFLFFSLSVSLVLAEDSDRPYNLVCLEKDGLINVLNMVVNPQQFLRNDLGQSSSYKVRKKIVKNSCSFEQIPKGSKARRAGFYQSENHFIFPLFSVTYPTGLKVYAAEGIFLARDWQLYGRHRKGHQGYNRFSSQIMPKTCEVIDEVWDLSKDKSPPDYVLIPWQCHIYIVD